MRIPKDGQMVTLPDMYPSMSSERLWRRCSKDNHHCDGEEGKMSGRTRIIKVVTTFTWPERKSKMCVDYMTAVLVYDSIHSLYRFLDKNDEYPQRRKFFLYHLAALEEVFRSSYASHGSYINDLFHYLNKLMQIGDYTSETVSAARNCDTCMVPFQALELIREELPSVPSVTYVINNVAARFQLYCGHIHRAFS